MAAHFHVEDRGERGIYLRSISESAHNWVIANQKPWHVVVGGALIERPFVDDILSDIARDGLVSVPVCAFETLQGPGGPENSFRVDRNPTAGAAKNC
jgi:hypothetical protein